MSRAFTDYPRSRRFPHLAPLMGAVPIYGSEQPADLRVSGLGATADAGVTPTIAPPNASTVPSSVTEPSSPSDELAVAAGTALLTGAVVGGVAAGSWRGAAIGAGMNAGVWSALTAGGNWSQLTSPARAMLVGAATVGIVGSMALVMTRKPT